ncbi:MAG: class II fumarate hydratase [Ilumatobacteraceae bacterium]
MSDPASVATHRVETDSLGPVEVAVDRLWGAQTERSLANFRIGRERYVWGRPVIRALGLVKAAAARANVDLGVLDERLGELIERAAGEVAHGDHDDHFPLVVFQTGSGTQTNMNANEVISNRAIQLAGGEIGSKQPVHPNDHVNRSQSSNDSFPTVMHVATLLELHERLHPSIDHLTDVLDDLAQRYDDVVTVGRTHLQDATPVRLGQVIGGWSAQVRHAQMTIRQLEDGLRQLAIGGTATGTGLNAPIGFGERVAEILSGETGLALEVTDNHFASMSAHDAMVAISGGLRTLAGALMKIANDVRWLASGPRNGLGELRIPTNEPGSSIMPGKVNPTQAEALTMVVTQVFGNDTAVAFAGSQGNFQLNVYKPIMLHDTLDSIALLADAIRSFTDECLVGLEPDETRIAENLAANLMLVTALVPHIGYDRAAEIAKRAIASGSTLREAAIGLGHVTADQYDEWIDPAAMTHPR